MATLADIRQRVYDNLYGVFPTESPFVSQLASSHNDTATTIVVLDEDEWEVNDVVENQDTGEQMIVTAVTTNGTNTLTVVRGWNGTTAASSSGSDDTLYKNPRFTQAQVDKQITAVLEYLEHWGIHAYGHGTITRANPKEYYELSDTDILEDIGVILVYEVEDNTELPKALTFRYQYNLGTGPSEYSQGHGVFMIDWGNTADTEVVYYTYAKKLDAVTDLLARQEELVVVGATAQLLGATITPATHDPGARTDRTIAPGQTSRDVRYFQGRFITEARLETAKLVVERQNMVHQSVRQARSRRWVN